MRRLWTSGSSLWETTSCQRQGADPGCTACAAECPAGHGVWPWSSGNPLLSYYWVPLSPMKCSESSGSLDLNFYYTNLCVEPILFIRYFQCPWDQAKFNDGNCGAEVTSWRNSRRRSENRAAENAAVFLHILQVWWWKSPPIGTFWAHDTFLRWWALT